MRNNNVYIEDTRFIFDTNFAGDPNRDKYGSDARKANLVIQIGRASCRERV